MAKYFNNKNSLASTADATSLFKKCSACTAFAYNIIFTKLYGNEGNNVNILFSYSAKIMVQ